MKEKEKSKIKLFPNYFKKIGIGIVGINIISYILLIINLSQFPQNEKIIFDIWANVLILGLFFIAFSKEKIEDERISLIRHKVLTYSFYTGILLALIMAVFNIPLSINTHDYQPYEARNLLTIVLGMYIMYFYKEKKK